MKKTHEKTALYRILKKKHPPLAHPGRRLLDHERLLIQNWGISLRKWTRLLNGYSTLTFKQAVAIADYLNVHPIELINE